MARIPYASPFHQPHASAMTAYRDVVISGWDCRLGGLDAARLWRVVGGGTSLLQRQSTGRWSGPDDDVAEPLALLRHAVAGPWAAIRDRPGICAWGLSTSKGDPWSFTPQRLWQAGPGHLGRQLAAELGVGLTIPCAVAAACSTGLYALLEVADHLAAGHCGRGLAGAVDGALPGWLDAGFERMGVLAAGERPQAFTGHGTGFAPAAGAAAIALYRGAALPGDWMLRGGVRLGDAGHETHFVDPRTLQRTLEGLWALLPAPELIVTHATGTAAGDAYEQAGLDDGPWAAIPRLHLKPMIGHTLGASGAVELAIALHAPVRSLWKLSLGFGGHVAAVACERA